MTKVPCFVVLALFASKYVDTAIIRLNDGGQGNAAVAFGSGVTYHEGIPGNVKQALRLQDQNNYSTVAADLEYVNFEEQLKIQHEINDWADRALRTPFWEVQQAWKPVVFVLDVSYGMRGKGMTLLRGCFERLIRHAIKDGNSVAVVAFGGLCLVVQNLTEVEGNATRDRLAHILDRLRPHPGSAIGCGLRMGTEVLESNGRLGKGGTIFLISQGGENREPYIKDELPKLVAKGFTVHTFSLDSSADKPFMEVAQKTGGRAYTFAEVLYNLKI